jgi:alkyl sulfatase BDS1-like metallo-beta-lactamase superfamily hydrolase
MRLNQLVSIAALIIYSHAAYCAPSPKSASEWTQRNNLNVYQQLPFNNTSDFKDASRGFIKTLSPMTIKDAHGMNAWDLENYEFIKGKAPVTVNPSLWRLATLNMNNGLFKVTDSVYQIRGFDLSNMTIIEGKTGIIIIDPLVTTEVARAGLELYYQERSRKPVVAVIYTHSHADHYGGVRGVVDEKEVTAGRVPVLAPAGFLTAAVSENVLAGNAMSRRSLYQYGAMLPRGEKGQVDAGLGKTTSLGTFTLISPTDIITRSGETRTIDGIKMEFQMAAGTEAPAEMLIWLPQFKILNTAEVATHTMHNLYTLRGAEVRDASAWWKVLNQAINDHKDSVEIVIAQHMWPTWGRENILNYLENQRDMFKYIHDQTLNLINKGLTQDEIAEQIKLPDVLAKQWYNRGYYDSVSHDSKGVYQRYMGWYTSHPADLDPLPPVSAAKKYVEYMGGAQAIMTRAKKDMAAGNYRWAAQVMKQVVFADPKNNQARYLQADALEQLGYQAENPTWRNEYLMGAWELRHGTPKLLSVNTASIDMINAMEPELILDFLGVRLNGPAANNKSMVINWILPDGTGYGISLKHSVLIYNRNKLATKPDVVLNCSKSQFVRLFSENLPLDKLVDGKNIRAEGKIEKLGELKALLDTFPGMFNIVTP